MRKIAEVIYLPTLRCNYDCAHCGQERRCEEKPCDFVLSKIESCEAIRNAHFMITGGEPFLKDGLSDFVCALLSWTNLNLSVHITTNGSFPEKIKAMLEKICDKHRISFSISIDGLEENHNTIRGNANAYEKAVQSVKNIRDAGVYVNVNTVVQPANLKTIREAKQALYKRLGAEVPISYIPIVFGISKKKEPSFSEEEISKIYSLLDRAKDKKYLLSGEETRIVHCHAGQKNIAIAPDGKIYTCLTGFSYFGRDKRSAYCMGDLADCSLSELWVNSIENGETWKHEVASCKGCTNPCELMREEQWFGLQFCLSSPEIQRLKGLIEQEKIELNGKWLPLSGWHPLESYDWGQLQWMSGNKASCLYKLIKANCSQISIAYCNSKPQRDTEPPVAISLWINQELIVSQMVLEESGTLMLLLPYQWAKQGILEIQFAVNMVWKASDYGMSCDDRTLGIALCDIRCD